MALFQNLRYEPVVQVFDKTRLDASKSFANSGDSITQIEIDSGDSGFVDVTSLGYLDTEYIVAGTKVVTVRLNGTDSKTWSLEVLSEGDDNLFSSDDQLVTHEPDILLYLRDGRNTYKDMHRRVQVLILDWLDSNRFWKQGKDRYTSADLVDIQDFKAWSAYWVLQLIFEGLSDKNDDKWMAKAKNYETLAANARERGTFRLDTNADGTITDGEKTDNWTKGLIRA